MTQVGDVKTFAANVAAAIESDGGLSRTEFNKLAADFGQFSSTQQSAVEGWLSVEAPQLAGILKNASGYSAYSGPRTLQHDGLVSVGDAAIDAAAAGHLETLEGIDRPINLGDGSRQSAEDMAAIMKAVGPENAGDFMRSMILADTGMWFTTDMAGWSEVASALGRAGDRAAFNEFKSALGVDALSALVLDNAFSNPPVSSLAELSGALANGGSAALNSGGYNQVQADLRALAQSSPREALRALLAIDTALNEGRLDLENSGVMFGADNAAAYLVNDGIDALEQSPDFASLKSQLPESRSVSR